MKERKKYSAYLHRSILVAHQTIQTYKFLLLAVCFMTDKNSFVIHQKNILFSHHKFLYKFIFIFSIPSLDMMRNSRSREFSYIWEWISRIRRTMRDKHESINNILIWEISFDELKNIEKDMRIWKWVQIMKYF